MTSNDNYCHILLKLSEEPINNHLTSWISATNFTHQSLNRSNLYIISGRPKALFDGYQFCDQRLLIFLRIKIGNEIFSFGEINLKKLINLTANKDFDLQKLEIDARDEVLFINYNKERIQVLTPDGILMRKGRNKEYISGFDNYLEAMTFDVYYIGIGTGNQNSYTRLIKNGHKNRSNIPILEEEHIYILLFELEPITVKIINNTQSHNEVDFNMDLNYYSLIKDAEKALIKIMQPKYNKQKYCNYPKGSDGIYNKGFNSYSYIIDEGIKLRFDNKRQEIGEADAISITGDHLSIERSKNSFF